MIEINSLNEFHLKVDSPQLNIIYMSDLSFLIENQNEVQIDESFL